MMSNNFLISVNIYIFYLYLRREELFFLKMEWVVPFLFVSCCFFFSKRGVYFVFLIMCIRNFVKRNKIDLDNFYITKGFIFNYLSEYSFWKVISQCYPWYIKRKKNTNHCNLNDIILKKQLILHLMVIII